MWSEKILPEGSILDIHNSAQRPSPALPSLPLPPNPAVSSPVLNRVSLMPAVFISFQINVLQLVNTTSTNILQTRYGDTCLNPSTQKAKAGTLLGPGKLGLYSEFEASLSYIARP
jgi:hypothetical protein